DAATAVQLERERPERRGAKHGPGFPDVHCDGRIPDLANQSRGATVEVPLLGRVRGGFPLGVGCWALDVGCWMLDVQRSTFNVQRSMPPGTFAACSGRRQSALTSLEMSGLASAATRFNGRAHVPSRNSAFTLIEMIAVLAVIAILAAVIAPTIIRRVDRAAWTKETANLDAIADSFTRYILRYKAI